MLPRKLPIFQVDAFAREPFGGNPAAVVILSEWLPDETLQKVAEENNLCETAFIVPRDDVFALRWFTPEVEVDLCGHATLASAHVLVTHGWVSTPEVVFETHSGTLTVEREGERLAMDFPSRPPDEIDSPGDLAEVLARALGARPASIHRSRDLLAVFDDETDIAALEPDFEAMKRIDTFGVIASAPGRRCDFVSRFFAPGRGVPEDPATGSAHCTLTPFWSARLGRKRLVALQISRRVGEFFVEDRGARVKICGRAFEYMRGEIFV